MEVGFGFGLYLLLRKMCFVVIIFHVFSFVFHVDPMPSSRVD